MPDERTIDDVRAGEFVGRPYRAAVEDLWAETRIWDYARYDGAGDLWINDIRVRDAAAAFGTPLEIVDTTILERRSAEWMALCREVAGARNYPGTLRYLYAAKANMASEITHAAYRNGWHAETSSTQDLAHLLWMREHGLLPEGIRVVCNGFKPAPEHYHLPQSAAERDPAGSAGLPLPALTSALSGVHTAPYAQQIVDMARDGWDICPILDQGELEYFSRPEVPPMGGDMVQAVPPELAARIGALPPDALLSLVEDFMATLPPDEQEAAVADAEAGAGGMPPPDIAPPAAGQGGFAPEFPIAGGR